MELFINNISKKIGKTVILDNFTYTFCSNEIYLISGKNGSGKTTLLKIIASLYLADSGKIKFENEYITETNELREYRKNIALLIDASKALQPNLTLLQNIKFFLGINNIDITEKSMKYLI